MLCDGSQQLVLTSKIAGGWLRFAQGVADVRYVARNLVELVDLPPRI